jgi:DNA-directed RNA polymerase sigma subunit (sigma70/sigma32)
MPILSVLDGRTSDPAAQARHLRAAITQQRNALETLLDERRRHATELRTAGWALAPIGKLYGLTPERVRQLVTSCSRTDDAAEGVA